MAVDNHAPSERPRQGSTPARRVWAGQRISQANGTEKRRDGSLAAQHGPCVNANGLLRMEHRDPELLRERYQDSRPPRE